LKRPKRAVRLRLGESAIPKLGSSERTRHIVEWFETVQRQLGERRFFFGLRFQKRAL
jgi:hypothetical protein